MKKIEKVLLTFAITLSVFVLVFVATRNKVPTAYASVAYGNDYHSTTTVQAITGVSLPRYSLLQTGNGTFGSIIITGANTGVINIYDGTTTSNHSDSATTTLASFPASTAAGTYTFDSQYYKGLIVEIIGVAPTSTVTFR